MTEPEPGAAIADRWRAVCDAVSRHCTQLGRGLEQCTIIAVTKTQSVEVVTRAVSAGITDFGENRVQEAETKILSIDPRPTWHMVGHLQTNKAARAARHFDWVHSVDSEKLAGALGRGADAANRDLGVLVQVNTTGESQKAGCSPDELPAVIEAVLSQDRLRLAGLMTIGPLSQLESETRKAFESAVELRDRWRRELPKGQMDVLSMGMSGDWKWALEYGANWLRIGTAIFGPRT